MADQVHNFAGSPPSSTNPQQKKHPEAFVVQIPKDQIHRYPNPPSNHAPRFQNSPSRRRSSCCRCLCCTIFVLIILIIISAIAAAIFYLLVNPKLPKYSVERIAFSGFNNISKISRSFSPSIEASIRAANPNDKIRIFYETESDVIIRYKDVDLCGGDLPVFRQPANNVTIFTVVLKGNVVNLSNAMKTELVRDERKGKVPLVVKVGVPLKLQIGSVKTWRFKVRVSCELTVSSLTAKSKIVYRNCAGKLSLSPW